MAQARCLCYVDETTTVAEYLKDTNAETGPAFVGIELTSRDDLEPLLERFAESGLNYEKIESDDLLYEYLV